MIVEMIKGATKEQIDRVVDKAHSVGFEVQLNIGTNKTVVALLGSDTGRTPTDIFAVLPGVEGVSRIMKPYKLDISQFGDKKRAEAKLTISNISSLTVKCSN